MTPHEELHASERHALDRELAAMAAVIEHQRSDIEELEARTAAQGRWASKLAGAALVLSVTVPIIIRLITG